MKHLRDEPAPRPLCTILVQRHLDDLTTGNGSYLLIFLRETRAAGFDVRLLFAPERSFGNRPWSSIHPKIEALVDRIDWPGSRRIGTRYVSLAPRVYGRFLLRLAQEAMRRLGIGGRLAKVSSLLGDEPWDWDADAIAGAVEADGAALYVAEYSALAPLLSRMPQGAAKAVLLHDLFSLRVHAMRAAGHEPDFVEITLEQEAERCRDADALFFASDSERAALSPLLPGRAAIWVRPDVGEHPLGPEEGAAKAVFLGTRHAGNLDALNLLCDEIWPAVLEQRPQAQLHVVGSIGADLPAHASSLRGLTVHGRVADLSSIGGPSSVGLAPTRAASGVSIKVAEYMRLGMSVVAMPAALEGFGDTLDDLLFCEPEPAAFARRVVALLDDGAERRRRAIRGRDAIGARLSNAALSGFLREVATTAAGRVRH